jgi:hypothetical protein
MMDEEQWDYICSNLEILGDLKKKELLKKLADWYDVPTNVRLKEVFAWVERYVQKERIKAKIEEINLLYGKGDAEWVIAGNIYYSINKDCLNNYIAAKIKWLKKDLAELEKE